MGVHREAGTRDPRLQAARRVGGRHTAQDHTGQQAARDIAQRLKRRQQIDSLRVCAVPVRCPGRIATCCVCVALTSPFGSSFAADAIKDFPLKPVRMVSPFSAGGTTDTLSRFLAPKLSERLGQPVITENRPGAGGMTGTNFVAKAAPDGYTLLFMSGAYTAQASVMKTLPYDPLRDLEGVSLVVTYPFVLVAKGDSPLNTVPDL